MDFESFIAKQANHFVKELIREGMGAKKPRRGFSESIRKRVLAVQNYRCNYCQRVLDVDNTGDVCDTLNVITADTIVSSDFTSLGNLIVQGNSILTVNPGVTLTITSGGNISVESRSGVLIKQGGTLEINL